MKKVLFLSVTALAGMMSIVSCSSEEDDFNPQGGTREEVKTSFTLSVGSVKPGTRMSADIVQQDQLFNGMEKIQLFPFISSGVVANENITIAPIHLADFDALDKINGQAKVYNDVVVPVGVNHFVFYGMSKEAGNGALSASYDNKALKSTSTLKDDVYFDLVSWNPGKTNDYFNTPEANGAEEVLTILNDVNTELTTQIAKATPGVDTQLSAIRTALQELTAGSSNSVRLFLQDVYDRLKGINHADAEAVIAVLGGTFTATGDNTTGYTLSWNTDPNFPGQYNLPDGAVALAYDTEFKYATTSVDGMNIAEIHKYTQPARLAYFVSTQAMTKNAPYLDSSADDTWQEVITNGAYSNDAVSLTTQSVILKEQIQYAVGRLDAKVKIADVTLYDNGETSADSDDQMVIAPDDGYTLTGVLIGGQKQVDWNFLPQGTEEFTIYDNSLTTDIRAKVDGYSDVNHTLALETAENTPVNVCFEFVNTGKDFYGQGNKIIPAGSKFYLVAQLNPGTNEIGNPNAIDQVFKQDYITTAQLTIGAKSLQKAYNVVPDLRSPKLELGLSVDLEWRTGITFEQEF